MSFRRNHLCHSGGITRKQTSQKCRRALLNLYSGPAQNQRQTAQQPSCPVAPWQDRNCWNMPGEWAAPIRQKTVNSAGGWPDRPQKLLFKSQNVGAGLHCTRTGQPHCYRLLIILNQYYILVTDNTEPESGSSYIIIVMNMGISLQVWTLVLSCSSWFVSTKYPSIQEKYLRNMKTLQAVQHFWGDIYNIHPIRQSAQW